MKKIKSLLKNTMNPKTKKPRLLITTDCYLPRWDGIARVLHEILPYLTRWEITIIAPQFEGTLSEQPGRFIQVPITKWMIADTYPAFPNLTELRKIIRQQDIVFNHTAGPIGLASIYLSRREKKPVVSYIHSIDWQLFSRSVNHFGWLIYYFTRIVERIAYNQIQHLITPSHEVGDLMVLNGITTASTSIPLGVNTDLFMPAKEKNREQLRREFGFSNKDIVIGYVGRLSREKNLLTLKRAFELIRRSHPTAHLLIVGSGVTDEFDLLIGPHVHLVGSKQNVIPYLQSMDIFVLPSLTETTSLATLEAMACELPVIVTRVGSVKSYVINGKNGLFFRRKSVRELTYQIHQLISDSTLRKNLGKHARQTSIGFSWNETAKKIDTLLFSILYSKKTKKDQ